MLIRLPFKTSFFNPTAYCSCQVKAVSSQTDCLTYKQSGNGGTEKEENTVWRGLKSWGGASYNLVIWSRGKEKHSEVSTEIISFLWDQWDVMLAQCLEAGVVCLHSFGSALLFWLCACCWRWEGPADVTECSKPILKEALCWQHELVLVPPIHSYRDRSEEWHRSNRLAAHSTDTSASRQGSRSQIFSSWTVCAFLKVALTEDKRHGKHGDAQKKKLVDFYRTAAPAFGVVLREGRTTGWPRINTFYFSSISNSFITLFSHFTFFFFCWTYVVRKLIWTSHKVFKQGG